MLGTRVVAGGRPMAGASSDGSWARIADSELPQLGPGVEPELLAQHVSTLLEHAEGIGLPAGAVQRDHQQAASRSRNGCAATSASSSPITPW